MGGDHAEIPVEAAAPLFAPRRAAVVRIPPAAGDRMSPACAAVVWAAARKMAAELGASVPARADSDEAAIHAAVGWQALLGRWIDEGDDGAIRGIVTFSTAPDGRMLVRRGALLTGAGATHEDLMLITPEADGRGADCMYQDSEGHVIQYTATWTDGRGLELASVPDAAAPRYRQSWSFDDADTLRVVFEFARAGGGELMRHSEGRLRRAQAEA
jgi:hypothetical protein